MEKYIGIIKKETETAIGVNISILTKYSHSKEVLLQWMKLYPNVESIILENNAELDSFFRDFEDYKPVTKDEKMQAEKLYNDLMHNE